MNAIFSRRSVRSFKDQPIENDKIDLLLRAAMQAPSACNSQPWEFIVITNKQTLSSIASIHPHAGMCTSADLAILVLATPGRQDGISAGFYPVDCAAAMQNILLEAAHLDLGACCCGIYPKENLMHEFKEFFGVPAGIIPFCLIAVGYPEKTPNPEDRFDASRIHIGKY